MRDTLPATLDDLAQQRAEAALAMRDRCAALVREEARQASSTDRTAWLMRIVADINALT